jgi:AcrR family transcriptional regulator
MAKLSPRQRRQARTRDEILAAALAIINEKGPDNLTLRALARRVDYSPAGLYEYFDGKDEIIEAVCAEGDRRLQEYLRAVPDDLPADQRLVELGLAYVRFAQANREHFMLMFTYSESGPLVPYETIEHDETYQLLLNAVQAAIDAGVIATRAGYGLAEIAYSLWALVHGMAMLHLINLRRLDYDFESANRSALAAFIRGLAQA